MGRVWCHFRFLLFGLLAVTISAPAFAEDQKQNSLTPEISAPVTPFEFYGDVRNLPAPIQWKPGDPIKEIPRRTSPGHMNKTQEPRPVGLDPLYEKQSQAVMVPDSFTTPTRNFDGGGFTGVNPPDTVGDVGPNHYIQMINGGSGAQVRIYEKQAPVPTLVANFVLESLGSGSCASGFGDPVVLYDEQADRWLLSEFASGNRLCVYISMTNDPVEGGWFNYAFQAPSFPDYPKYSVWPTDANNGQGTYVVVTNEGAPIVYALRRAAMLSGLASTYQRFANIPPLPGFPFQGILAPADVDGPTAPPTGSAVPILHHRDTEVHGPPGSPTQDFLEVWELNVNWTTPASSALTNTVDVSIQEIDSHLCGLVSFSCFPQPGTGVTLDPLREPVMHRLQYINFGSHQTLVGDFVTDVDGTDHGGMRWFELRGGAGNWSLFQEGLYSIDQHHRWIGGIAMDTSGNIAMGYSVSSTSVHPDIRYTGRLTSDPIGTMSQAETVVVDGTASNGSNRWGDYANMSLDPADDCTFWYTTMYNSSSQWKTRIASMRFDTCGSGCPAITISPSTLPDGTVGTAYNQTLVASGGTSPYTYAVTTGSLPTGLSLNVNSGAITGTPTAGGSFSFTITATDTNICTGSQTYTIDIDAGCPAITLSPTTLPDGIVGTSYNQTLVASGGTSPYTYAVTTGSLPTSLSLNSNTGAITGTPTAEGSFTFTITATDADTCTGSQSYTIDITAAPTCLFCDDFEDGVIDPNWTYVKQNWTEDGDALIGTPVRKKAEVIASPIFSGCSMCEVQAIMQTTGGAFNKVWLLAWRGDKKNVVELLMREETDRFVLKQRSNGQVVAKGNAQMTVDANTPYDVRIDFDGTNFELFVDDVSVLILPAVGAPNGTVGFRVRNTTARFEEITVN